MEKVLHVQSVNDYARHVGASVLHPLVSVIHYDELEQCHHALCEYGVYGLFLMKESPYTISYGGGSYRFESGIPTVRYLSGQLFLLSITSATWSG